MTDILNGISELLFDKFKTRFVVNDSGFHTIAGVFDNRNIIIGLGDDYVYVQINYKYPDDFACDTYSYFDIDDSECFDKVVCFIRDFICSNNGLVL